MMAKPIKTLVPGTPKGTVPKGLRELDARQRNLPPVGTKPKPKGGGLLFGTKPGSGPLGSIGQHPRPRSGGLLFGTKPGSGPQGSMGRNTRRIGPPETMPPWLRPEEPVKRGTGNPPKGGAVILPWQQPGFREEPVKRGTGTAPRPGAQVPTKVRRAFAAAGEKISWKDRQAYRRGENPNAVPSKIKTAIKSGPIKPAYK